MMEVMMEEMMEVMMEEMMEEMMKEMMVVVDGTEQLSQSQKPDTQVSKTVLR